MMQRILLVSLLEMRMLKIAPKEVSISVAYPDLVKSEPLWPDSEFFFRIRLKNPDHISINVQKDKNLIIFHETDYEKLIIFHETDYENKLFFIKQIMKNLLFFMKQIMKNKFFFIKQIMKKLLFFMKQNMKI